MVDRKIKKQGLGINHKGKIFFFDPRALVLKRQFNFKGEEI